MSCNSFQICGYRIKQVVKVVYWIIGLNSHIYIMEDDEKLIYSEEVKEVLENVRGGSDYVLHLNYQQLKGLPKEVYDDDDYSHVKRIYMKQNLVQSLVSTH